GDANASPGAGTPVHQRPGARGVMEPIQERPRHALPDLPVPVQELSPQWHVLKSTRSHPSRRHVRAGEQTTIRVEVVQPRRPDHLPRPIRRAMQMLEEGGQLRTPLIPAFDPECGEPIALGTPEVQPDTISAEPSEGETTSGRHDTRRLRLRARQ